MRVHGTTRRRPVDLFQEEQAALKPLPADPFEVSQLGHYKVRKDCHVHVLGNYYSVPFSFVGQKVTVRVREHEVAVLAAGECVASHERALGRGQSVTDPTHYPPSKRLSTQEIHRRRLERLRAVGPRTAEYLSRLREGPWVFGDQLARLVRLLERFGGGPLERACHRAVHFGALDGAARVESILERGVQDQPLEDLSGDPRRHARDFGRPLAEYDELLLAKRSAS